MTAAMFRAVGSGKDWTRVVSHAVPRSVARRLRVRRDATTHLLAVAFDPESFDPTDATGLTLLVLRAAGLVDPVVFTTFFALPRRTGAAADRWLDSMARQWLWPDDISWHSPDRSLTVFFSAYPDGDGGRFAAWGARSRTLLDLIADQWPADQLGDVA